MREPSPALPFGLRFAFFAIFKSKEWGRAAEWQMRKTLDGLYKVLQALFGQWSARRWLRYC